MKTNKTLLFSVVVSIYTGSVWGAVSAGYSDDKIRADALTFGKWFSEEVGHMTAVNAVAGPQLPADVHNLLGFEVGLSAVASSSKVDVDGFNNLPWTELQPGGFNMPSDVVMAMPMVHAKVGLPFALDLGLKYGHVTYNNTDNGAKSEIKNSVMGVEVRRRLMGEGVTGAVLPDVALTLGYDQANGDVSRSQNYVSTLKGGDTLTGNANVKSEWTTGAVTARVVASKQILILTPYLGVGYSRLFGNADTTVNVLGTVLNPNDVNVSEKSSENADGDLTQLVGGVEFTFFPMMKLNVGGLYAKDDWSASLGLRFTFR